MSRSKKDAQIELNGTLQSLICPNSIEEGKSYVKLNDKLNKILMAVDYPWEVHEGFLDKIIRLKGDFDISLHIEPQPAEAMMVRLNNTLNKLRADRYGAEKEGKPTQSHDFLIRDTSKLLDYLQSGKEKLFEVSLYINVKGWNEQEVNMLARRIQAELNSIMIISRQPTYKMRQGLESVLPLGKNKLKVTKTLTTSALSACFPFTSVFLVSERGGIMLATNKLNDIPIIKDPFTLTNLNSLTLSTSGSGKSYLTKLLLIRHLMAGVQVFVIDPQAEYLELTKAVDGQIVEISRNSDTIINVLDLLGQPFDEKRLSLLSAFNIMFGGLSEPQTAILDKAISTTYERKNIRVADRNSWANDPPTLSDLHESLADAKREATRREHTTYDVLLNRLEMYTNGVFSFLNQQTSLNLTKDFICFDIQKMPTAVQPLMMYLILEYVYARMRENKARKVLAIDEAWLLLNHTNAEDYLFKIVKTSRKFNLALMIITQEVNDLLRSSAGQAVLANTSCKYLLRQDPSVIDNLVKTLHLSEMERNILLSSRVGDGILVADNERYPIKIVASPQEDSLITTKADVLHKRELHQKHENVTKPNEVTALSEKCGLDLNKGFYKKCNLTPEQIKALKRAGYVQTKQRGFSLGGSEYYLIKSGQTYESHEHFFLVKGTEEIIREHTDKVETFSTVGPDLVFENKNGERVAVEVETGQTMGRKLAILERKVEKLNQDYGNNWFFVLTKAKHKYQYSKLGETISRTQVPARIGREFGE